MAGKNTAVFGIYKSAAEAERAVDQIAVGGFSHNDISVLLPDSHSTKEFAHEKNTKAPEGTTTGVTAGGAVGGAWAYWPALEPWLFRASARSSRRVQSWALLRG